MIEVIATFIDNEGAVLKRDLFACVGDYKTGTVATLESLARQLESRPQPFPAGTVRVLVDVAV